MASNADGGGGDPNGVAPRPLQMGAKGAYIVRLLMVGDSSCGKTSLVLRFDQNVFSTKFVTTIGVDYRDKMVKVCGTVSSSYCLFDLCYCLGGRGDIGGVFETCIVNLMYHVFTQN